MREEALRAAYELGRDAVEASSSVLDLAAIHHEVFLRALAGHPGRGAEVQTAPRAAEEFFLESLSAFEIVRRSYHEQGRRRSPSGETPPSCDSCRASSRTPRWRSTSRDAVAEMLQLLAEQAREIVDADSCTVAARGRRRGELAR